MLRFSMIDINKSLQMSKTKEAEEKRTIKCSWTDIVGDTHRDSQESLPFSQLFEEKGVLCSPISWTLLLCVREASMYGM